MGRFCFQFFVDSILLSSGFVVFVEKSDVSITAPLKVILSFISFSLILRFYLCLWFSIALV